MSTRRALGALLAGLLACSSESEPAAALAPGEFRLEPSRGEVRVVRRDPTRGMIERRGLSLVEQLAAAWQVAARDLDFRVDLPAGKFDLSVRAADATSHTAEALVRGGLAEHFGFRVRSERRQGDVFVLSLVRHGLVPEPIEPGSVEGEPVRVDGRYRGAGARIEHLARYLRRFGQRPIVDETGLAGHYDVALEWDPEAGPRAFHTALRDAGFVLTGAQRSFVVYVVEPVP